MAIRCRPMSQKEIKDGCKVVIRVDHLRGQVGLRSSNSESFDKGKIFTFDTVFRMDAKQVDIYNETARPIVDLVLEGFNGSAYIYAIIHFHILFKITYCYCLLF